MIERTNAKLKVSTGRCVVEWLRDGSHYKLVRLSSLENGTEVPLVAQPLRSFRIHAGGKWLTGWPTAYRVVEDSSSRCRISFTGSADSFDIVEDWTFDSRPYFELSVTCRGKGSQPLRLLCGFKMPHMMKVPFNPFCDTLIIPAACFGKEVHLGVRNYRKEYQPVPLLYLDAGGRKLGVFYDPREDSSICVNDERYTPSIDIQAPNQDAFEEKLKEPPLKLHFWMYPGATLGEVVRAARAELGYEPLRRKKPLDEFADEVAAYCLKDGLIYHDDHGAQLYSNESESEGFRRNVGFGFTPFSSLTAQALYEYGRWRGSARARDLSGQILSWIRTSRTQSKTGAVWDMYYPDNNEFGDFFGDKRFWVWPQSLGAKCLLGMEAPGAKTGLDAFHAGLAKWLLGCQQPCGGWPRFVWEAGGLVSTETTACNAIVPAYLLALHEKTGDKKLKDAALRASDWVIQEFVDRMNYRGGEEDESADQDGSFPVACVVMGLAAAFRATRMEKYLEAAKRAGDVLMCWQYIWNIPQSRYPTQGIVACTNHFSKYAHHGFFDYDHTITHSPWETALCGQAAIELAELTGQREWLDFATGCLNANQYLQFEEGRLKGGIREGYCGIVDGEWALAAFVNIAACALSLQLACQLAAFEQKGK